MAYRRFLRFPIAALVIALATAGLIIGCGGAAEESAPQEQQQVQQQAPATSAPAPVRATNTPIPQDATLAPTPTQRASVLQATPRPTLAPQTEGELVTNRLIAVLDPPSLESMLDCEVTGSGVVNYRMSAEFMVDAGRFDGSYEPMLATEWAITPDGRTWNFKLRQGVRWHDDWGEFTAQDVKHSLAYYTNPECRASYSDYFRNDPGSDVEIVNDYEVNIHMQKRPAVDFLYWFSGYRGVPISSKAQWDQACPGGEAEYNDPETGEPVGYCKASRDAVYEKSARTGPYEYVSFEEGVGWEWQRVDYDHWRVDADFEEIEIKDVREPATRLAIMQAREGHIAAINRALLQDAIDDGLEVFDSSVTAQTTFAIFGGMYFATGEKGIDPNASAENQAADREAYNIVAARDEMHPWNDPGESGKLVRMAMNKALDRDQINDAIFKGAGGRQWVATLVPDFAAGYNPAWEDSWDELYGYDPDKARELLAEAGYPNGFSFRIPVFPLSGVPEMPDMMEAMAKFWTEIGLDPSLDPIEFSNWRNEYRGLNTDCCVYPFRGPAAPIDTRVHFYFSAERFFRAYSSDDIQENKNKALRALNEADATADWQKVSDEIFYNAGTIPGWTLPVSAVVDPDVVAEYIFLGPNNGNYVYLEHVKGVRE
ncbi:MAG: ABC transporter substrate-binding protein [Chloroflexi bacterium]|nr:ABC transporter substrate-binding protein [Chloroflexota bacterium]MYD49623.1 ABC transporter substrate-binding protein [Chloroflexota bacterium]